MDERYIQKILTSGGPRQIDYNALANLPKSITTTATIGTTWAGDAPPFTQDITIEGVTAKSVVEISLPVDATVAEVAAYQSLNLQDGGQGANTITLNAFGEVDKIEKIPIRINVVIRKDLE